MEDSDKPEKKRRAAAKPKREVPKATPSETEARTNAILFQDDKPSASGGSLRVDRAPKAERAAPDKQTATREEGSATRQVPDTVRERFIQIGNNFFFPDGAEAFTTLMEDESNFIDFSQSRVFMTTEHSIFDQTIQ